MLRKKIWVAASIFLIIGINGCGVKDKDDVKKEEAQKIQNISVSEARELIEDNKNNKDFKIIDVRTPAEFSKGHIDGAILIDYYDEKFKESLNKLNKENTYLIYCRSGNRSSGAISIMERLGFKKVYNMLGGISAWKMKKFPLVE